MPRRSPFVLAAIVLCIAGLALVVVGVVVLTTSHKGLGLALMGGGLAVVFVGSWASTLKRRAGDEERPDRGA